MIILDWIFVESYVKLQEFVTILSLIARQYMYMCVQHTR